MKEKYYRYSLKLSDKRIVKLVRSYIYHCKKYLLYFQEVEQNQTPDICFIDNDEDLIELKTNDQLAQPYIIFLHDQKKLTPRTSSLSYLYVPDFEKEWSKILQKIVCRLAYAPKYLMAKSYKEYQFIDLSKIAYLEADNFNTIVVLTTGEHIQYYEVLKSYTQRLPANFLRIHRSYIINIYLINKIHLAKRFIKLNGFKTGFPIGKTYAQQIEYLISQFQNQSV